MMKAACGPSGPYPPGNTHVLPDLPDQCVKGVIHSHPRLGRRLDEGDAVVPVEESVTLQLDIEAISSHMDYFERFS